MDRMRHLLRWRRRHVVIPTADRDDPTWTASMRWLGPFVTGTFVLSIPFVLVGAALDPSIGLGIFAAFWTVFALLAAHEALASDPTYLQLTDDRVYWSSRLRTGSFAVTDLERIERRGGVNRMVTFCVGDACRLTVRHDARLAVFCDEVLIRAPHAFRRDIAKFATNELGEHPDGWSSLPRTR